MQLSRGRSTPPSEAGFALIEVVVSAVIVVVAATGVVSLMQAAVHSAGDQRNRSQAYALAQEDQARLRSKRIPTLKNLKETNEVTLDNVTYKVFSTASYVNDVSGLASCGKTTSSADYIKIASEVTWPNMSPIPAQVIRSIIAPPSGTLNPKAGTLTVSVENASGGKLSAISLSGTGTAGTFSGSSDSSGCAVFVEQPEGTYTMTVSGGASTLVNKDGVALPENRSVTVNPESTTSVNLYYDSYGSVPIALKTTNYSGVEETAETEYMVAYNTEMTTGKLFGSPGVKWGSKTATPLYPFTTGDSFYTGACSTNAPTSGTVGIVNYTVLAGQTAPTQNLLMPALLLNVKVNSTATNGVAVKVTDNNSCPANPTRNYTTATVPVTTGTAGRLSAPELPWGTYTICASTSISGTTRHETLSAVDVKTATTVKEINLTSFDSSGGC